MGLQRDLPRRVAFGGSRAEEYAGSSVSDPSAMAASALDTLLWAIAPAAVVALSAPLQPETLLTGGVMVAQGNNHTSLEAPLTALQALRNERAGANGCSGTAALGLGGPGAKGPT